MGGSFCCCDMNPAIGVTCSQSPNEINVACGPLCDPFFQVKMLDCQDSDPCQVTVVTDALIDSDPITNTSYHFGFFLSEFPNEVV